METALQLIAVLAMVIAIAWLRNRIVEGLRKEDRGSRGPGSDEHSGPAQSPA